MHRPAFSNVFVVCFLLFATLAPTAQALTVEGRVVDIGGRGLTARVELWPSPGVLEEAPGAPILRARANGGGEFAFEGLDPGFYQLAVHYAGHASAVYELDPLMEDITLPRLVLPTAAGQLLVKVESGAGVQVVGRGWSVDWRQRSRSGWLPHEVGGRTGTPGTVELPCAPGERVRVIAEGGAGFAQGLADCGERLTLTLEPLESSILEASEGAPASGVTVLARWPLHRFGQSDEEGRLLLPRGAGEDLPPLLALDASGLYGAPEILPREDGAVRRLRLPAVPAHPGRVQDAMALRPLEGAWVWSGRDTLHRVRSDAEGAYTLRWPEGEGKGPRAALPGYLQLPGRDDEADLFLAPSIRWTGRVFSAEGDPLSGADLELWEEEDGNAVGEARRRRSGEGGAFELPPLLPDTNYLLRVQRRGYEDGEYRLPAVPAGAAGEPMELVLQPVRRAYGRVLESDEQPLAGASVELFASLQGRGLGQGVAYSHDAKAADALRAVSDAEGWFVFLEPPPGPYYLAARAAGFPELMVPGVDIVESEQEQDLGTLFLHPGLELSGRVTVGREPAAGVRIDVRRDGEEEVAIARQGSVWFTHTTTAPDGSYRLSGLPPERGLILLVHGKGYLPLEMPVRMGEDSREFDLEMERPCRVEGRVVDVSGRPLLGGWVRAEQVSGDNIEQVVIDSAGRFEFDALRCPVEYQLWARGAGGSSGAVRLRPEASFGEVELRMGSGAGLRGRVVDQDDRPVGRARVRIPGIEGTRSVGVWTDPAGEFTLEGLEPGPQLVEVDHRDYESKGLVLELEEGESHWVDVRLDPRLDRPQGARLAGRVVDATGQPVEGAVVRAFGDGAFSEGWSDASGAFAIELAAERFRFGAQHAEYATYSSPWMMAEEVPAELEVVLHRGATVRGFLTGLPTDEYSGVTVQALGAVDLLHGVVRYDGSFEMAGLGAGEWTLRAELVDPPRMASTQVSIEPGMEELRADLVFESGLRILGLAYLEGRVLAGGVVQVSCAGDYRGRVLTAWDGAFTLEHVPPGRHCTLTLKDPVGGRSIQQEIHGTEDVWLVLEIPPAER